MLEKMEGNYENGGREQGVAPVLKGVAGNKLAKHGDRLFVAGKFICPDGGGQFATGRSHTFVSLYSRRVAILLHLNKYYLGSAEVFGARKPPWQIQQGWTTEKKR